MLISMLFLITSFMIAQEMMIMLWLTPMFLFYALCKGVEKYDGLFFSDFLSFSIIMVTLWVYLFSTLEMKLSKSAMNMFWAMMIFSVMSFLTSNLISFYVMFELVFILMFSFLIGWGTSMERVQASFYMLFYTLIFSLPFLILLVEQSKDFSSLMISLKFFTYKDFLWVFMMMVFFVKLPLWGLHLWLPKAHVEAPLSGSMALSGILLKLGGYGIIRFMPIVSKSISNSMFMSHSLSISLWGCILSSFMCVRLMDLKMIIAYSSVVHMSVMMSGILSESSSGINGSILMMVAHGFISPLMFFLFTYMYMNWSSRSIMIIKGFMVSSTTICMMWFITCSLNMGFPPFMSFFSEIMIIGSLKFCGIMEMFSICLILMMSGVYNTIAFVTASHGSPYDKKMKVVSVKMLLTFFSMVLPVVVFIFLPIKI